MAIASLILVLSGGVVVTLAGVVWLILSTRPLGFLRADGEAFIAPSRNNVAQVGIAGGAVLSGVGFLIAPAYLAPLSYFDATIELVFGAMILLIYRAKATTRARLLINADGIEVRGLTRTRMATWDSLADPFALYDAGLRGGQIPVRGTSKRGGLLHFRHLDVPESRVLGAIFLYRDHADHRSKIGDWNELARISALQPTLAEAPQAVQSHS